MLQPPPTARYADVDVTYGNGPGPLGGEQLTLLVLSPNHRPPRLCSHLQAPQEGNHGSTKAWLISSICLAPLEGLDP